MVKLTFLLIGFHAVGWLDICVYTSTQEHEWKTLLRLLEKGYDDDLIRVDDLGILKYEGEGWICVFICCIASCLMKKLGNGVKDIRDCKLFIFYIINKWHI